MKYAQLYSLFSDFDIELFKAGKHFRLYEKFGARVVEVNNQKGVYFSVWAPSAYRVSVIGDFNGWDENKTTLNARWDSSGIWEGFVPNAQEGDLYKYKIYSHLMTTEKADPFAFRAETPPKTASVVRNLTYRWSDGEWMKHQAQKNSLDKPFSIYEVHLGSWRKNQEENRSLSYTELATELVEYVKEMGFTHVEFMPVMEYPYDPSWGYQITGYFAPTSRFGTPQEFMHLVDRLHQADIGVLLDWVPSHFPEDAHGLGLFDGSHLYEHPHEQRGRHPDWGSLIFNYGRNEVRAFLISNALFWLDLYHADGLRVDAVASMLYLDYSRKQGEWTPNIRGDNTNLEAVSFLQELNETVYAHFPGVQTMAEESSSFPMVSRPTYAGGLGFGMKWMMGWMNDILRYFKREPLFRTYHQSDISFSLIYAFGENFLLPLSHDEVVHGKGSLLSIMPGDEWQRFANLRLLFSYMFGHPGAKLLFMGGEIAQYDEWDFSSSIQWHLLSYPIHHGLQKCVKALNKLYTSECALYEKQFSPEGFEWIIHDDHTNCILAFMRKGHDPKNTLIFVCNFTPKTHSHYCVGVHEEGVLVEIFNSDEIDFGGSGVKNTSPIKTKNHSWNGKPRHIEISVPPLGAIVLKYIPNA